MFCHGVSRERVDSSTITALECLKPLYFGECREGKEIEAAPIEAIEATLPELRETFQSIVRLQLFSGMRPTEVFGPIPAQIDRSGDVWFHRKVINKSLRHKVNRAVPLVGDAMEIIAPHQIGDPDELMFKSDKRTTWNKDTYRWKISRACKRVGVQWTPRQLRTTASQKVRDALRAELAQALLAHQRMDTTEINAKPND